jgi:hypothetical protein
MRGRLTQGGDGGDGFLGVVHDGRFGHFQFDQGRRETGVAQHLADVIDQLRASEVARGEVDGHFQLDAGFLPGQQLGDGVFQNPAGQRTDQLGVLDLGNESAG